MDSGRAAHWQEEWLRAGLATATRAPDREKFYALIAYPGTSGFLHVGHLRAFAYADALHRYHRMRGRRVFFPFGVHASGLPAVTWSQKVRDRDAAVVQQLKDRGVPMTEWPALEEPENAARFLGRQYVAELHRVGALIDDRSYLTTIDDDYRAFVRWQFRALHAAGALVRGSYFASVCPVCGPVAVDPSETDLSSGGDAEVVRFVTIPFRLEDGRFLLAATLRPETVFGVTNLWLPPEGTLAVWHHDDRLYLVAPAAAERLVEQHGGRVGHTVPVADVLGRSAVVPFREAAVPIWASSLVDPDVGTGVVMSVPAHAPADAAALAERTAEERSRVGSPPVLLTVDTTAALSSSEEALLVGDGTPAERALRATGARGPEDRAAVDLATERLYRIEFVRGRMTIPPLAGVPVREARERVARDLAGLGGSFEFQEFSKPVVCRNGHRVVIRRVPDQWFIRYSDPEWKSVTRRAMEHLTTWPREYRHELSEILDWYADRPCVRRGRWLGTPFPFDPEWLIEPIADSTFYMAYFVVRRYVSTGRVPPTALTDAFFDHVFLGRGPGEPTLDPAIQAEVRDEFLYWYPLDYNIGGKEHKRVHFPVFLYTHAKLLPAELQPRGVYVNGLLTGPAGVKISKKEVSSKGGRIPPIDRALERWGPDALRLYYVVAASPDQDLEWSEEAVDTAEGRLGDVERMVRDALGDTESPPELETWLLSEMHRRVAEVVAAFDATDLRTVAEVVYSAIPALLRRYYARGGAPGSATDRVARAWIRLLAPITPHLAEELGSGRFTGLVAVEPMPTPDDFPRSEDAEAREEFLARVEEDLRAVLRPLRERGEATPDAAVFFVADGWKTIVESWLRDGLDRGVPPTVRDVMERAREHPELAAHRAEIPKYVERVGAAIRTEPRAAPRAIDELGTLRAAEGYLARRLGFATVSVHREAEGASVDPKGRRERARPGRPAFYLTRPGSAGRPP